METHYRDEVEILATQLARIKTRLLEIATFSDTITDEEKDIMWNIDGHLISVKTNLSKIIENE